MKFPDSDVFWPLLIVGVLFFVSGRSDLAVPSVGFSLDKVAHAVVFGALATSIVRLPAFRGRGWRGAGAAVLISLLYGGMDEFRQSFTPGRSVELMDLVADGTGAMTAACLYQGNAWYRNLLEWTLHASA
jgi:VanZ family protein